MLVLHLSLTLGIGPVTPPGLAQSQSNFKTAPAADRGVAGVGCPPG